jgi:hypothetical protein
MKKLLWLTVLPSALFAAEVRTWTFSMDGKGEVSGSEFSFRKGGRMDGAFVRFVQTNDVVIKRLPDGADCRIRVSCLSSNDLAYLSKFILGSDLLAKERARGLKDLEAQAQAVPEQKSVEATGRR